MERHTFDVADIYSLDRVGVLSSQTVHAKDVTAALHAIAIATRLDVHAHGSSTFGK